MGPSLKKERKKYSYHTIENVPAVCNIYFINQRENNTYYAGESPEFVISCSLIVSSASLKYKNTFSHMFCLY